MKYRIKKVTYVNKKGEIRHNFYPQHKHWWSWWHYYGSNCEYCSYDVFSTLEDAIHFIMIEIRKRREYKEEYIYLDNECKVV